jgi:hypothetical protein
MNTTGAGGVSSTVVSHTLQNEKEDCAAMSYPLKAVRNPHHLIAITSGFVLASLFLPIGALAGERWQEREERAKAEAKYVEELTKAHAKALEEEEKARAKWIEERAKGLPKWIEEREKARAKAIEERGKADAKWIEERGKMRAKAIEERATD